MKNLGLILIALSVIAGGAQAQTIEEAIKEHNEIAKKHGHKAHAPAWGNYKGKCGDLICKIDNLGRKHR